MRGGSYRWRSMFASGQRISRWASAVCLAIAALGSGACGAQTQVITEFSNGISGAGIVGIATGPDGNLWFAEGNNPPRIGKITTAGVVTEYSSGISSGADALFIASGPDGNLWFTEFTGNRIGKITIGGLVTEYSSGITPFSSITDITAGPDGNLWFTEAIGRIGRITTAGVVTEFSSGISAGSGTLRHHARSGWQPLVHGECRQSDREDYAFRRYHRVQRRNQSECSAERHRRRS